jgi:outer membrane lipoprotein-sorting protein
VARTAFLFIENKDRGDDQYMYLPALNVIRRIVGSQKDASFMGSDFTYADLESRDFDDAKHKLLGTKKVGSVSCYVVESKPKRETYSKIVSWIRKADNVFLRIDYYDKRGQLLKVFTTRQVKKIGDMKVLTRFRLSNKQTKHATVIAVTDIKLRPDLSDDLFTKRALKKR